MNAVTAVRGALEHADDDHTCDAMTDGYAGLKALEMAIPVLVRLIREEYPDKPLAEIAAIWGAASAEEVAAIAAVTT